MEILQDEQHAPAATGNRFFLWSVVLLLMTGACFASWIGSFYVVNNPENPKCYRILKRFKRIEPPKRFKVTEAPKGDFLSAARLLDRYGKLGKVELARENAELLRAYVMNFRETKRRVPYVAGRYQVVQSYDLRKSDMFPSGAVAIAQAENLPQVLVEYVFPAAPKNVTTIREVVAMGADITLERSHDLWALIHIERHTDGRMQFTVVPLPYGGWQLKKRQGSFTLQSPEELSRDWQIDLNIDAGLPVVRDPRLANGLAAHKEFRRKALADAGDDQAALTGLELVRFEPAPSETDEAPKASHAPVPNPKPDQHRFVRPVPTPAPTVPLPPRPIVRNQPLIGAAPSTAILPTPTPAPAPPAAVVAIGFPTRVLSVSEASQLVGKYDTEGPATLSGDFVVTGVLDRRVALRTRESLRDPDADPAQPGNSAALVVVEFPEGTALPTKNSTLTRASSRGFLIRDVIRGRDGQITIVTVERPNK